MGYRTIPYLLAFVLLARFLPAQGWAEQHSISILSSARGSLSFSESAPPLAQGGLRSEIDARYAISGPFFASLSFGWQGSAPSLYSAEGVRYRGFSSVFLGGRAGAFLPFPNRAASLELGAALDVGSWTSTDLAFAFAEIQGAFRLRDPSPSPFYASWLSLPGESGSLRAEFVLPFAFMFLPGSYSFAFGAGACLRRESMPRLAGRKAE